MGIEIKLTDRELAITPVFIDFLHQHLTGSMMTSQWHDQLSELLNIDGPEIVQRAQAALPSVVNHPKGKSAIDRSYELCIAILVGATDRLTPFHNRYKFICVVGAPRSGGSYLTKQLFIALGIEPRQVPTVIAHDGFPTCSPFFLEPAMNASTIMTRRTAEYLTMVELYFENTRRVEERIVVPKKATTAAYQGAFFDRVLGPGTEYLITIRHPVTSCISSYEKSGGLPANGKFIDRSFIETSAGRDYLFTSGETQERVLSRDYFEVYLRYWEQFHYNLALTGLSANRLWTIVPYTAQAITEAAQQVHERFGSTRPVEAFHVFDKRDRHLDWYKKAEPAIRRVREVWSSVGLSFPLDEVMLAW
jgi:hypothetical protein